MILVPSKNERRHRRASHWQLQREKFKHVIRFIMHRLQNCRLGDRKDTRTVKNPLYNPPKAPLRGLQGTKPNVVVWGLSIQHKLAS